MSDQGFTVGDIDAVKTQEENAIVKEVEKIEAMAVDGRASGPLRRCARKVLFKRKTRLRKFISKGWLQTFYLNILLVIRRTYTALTFENSEDLSLPTIVLDVIAKAHWSAVKTLFSGKKKLSVQEVAQAGTKDDPISWRRG